MSQLINNKCNYFFLLVPIIILANNINIYGSSNQFTQKPDNNKASTSFGGTWEYNITYKYQPHLQPDDQKLTENRKQLDDPTLFNKDDISLSKVKEIFPETILINKAKPGERPGVCYHVAMKTILQLSDEQFKTIEKSILGLQDWVTVIGMPYLFFNQKENPKPNYLVTYTPNNNIFNIKHFGVVSNDGKKIISKIGFHPYTFLHQPWHLPLSYGNTIRYWKLKKNFIKDKGFLFNQIMNRIKKANSLKYYISLFQNQLLTIANEKFIPKPLTDANYSNFEEIILICMALDINYQNKNGETALMLAAQRGDERLIKIILKYHANVNLKNKNGETASILAYKNKHYSIILLLLESIIANENNDIINIVKIIYNDLKDQIEKFIESDRLVIKDDNKETEKDNIIASQKEELTKLQKTYDKTNTLYTNHKNDLLKIKQTLTLLKGLIIGSVFGISLLLLLLLRAYKIHPTTLLPFMQTRCL